MMILMSLNTPESRLTTRISMTQKSWMTLIPLTQMIQRRKKSRDLTSSKRLREKPSEMLKRSKGRKNFKDVIPWTQSTR
jgi:hypothetical protein